MVKQSVLEIDSGHSKEDVIEIANKDNKINKHLKNKEF